MDSSSRSDADRTIGDLAQRTGVAPATLRMWETRHGFPEPVRRGSGHRRYAELRRRHPHLQPPRLTKATLLALSWAIEDEFCARADRATVFGAFQHERYHAPAARRWRELARVSRAAFALYAGAPTPTPVERAAGPHLVPLAEDSPLRREWAVVCDPPELPALLTAFELPGQADEPPPGAVDLATASTLVNRVVGYVDRFGRH